MDMSVVIPVFNEAEGLSELRRRLTEVLGNAHLSFEVILVDDGSQDHSRSLMTDFHQEDERFRALFLSRNFGHQIAITAGLMHAKGDTIAIMDADLQDPPEVLKDFWKKLKEGYDVVYGVRRNRKEHVFKRLGYYIFYRLLNKLSDYPIPLDSGDFCLMSRRIVDHLNKMSEGHRYLRGLRAWSGFRQTGIEYERAHRYTGPSKYTFTKLFNLALDGLMSFSAIPVRSVIQFGFLTAVTSFVIGLVHLILKLFNIGNWPSGFASLFLLVAFLGGIQLITIGMIGEYIARVHMEVKKRPLFLVSEYIGIDASNQYDSHGE